MKITIGRTVLYRLNEQDAAQINRRRTNGSSIAARIEEGKWPEGAQAHIGNVVQAGEAFPAVALRVWGSGDNPPVNLRVLLDGNDDLWATSRHEGPDNGQWFWPTRE